MFLNEKVYVKAKECGDRLSVEEFAILLGNHFSSFYPQVYISAQYTLFKSVCVYPSLFSCLLLQGLHCYC